MAENTRTFQEILLEQRNTNKELASLKQENRLMSDVLKDIKEDAVKDSTNQGILRSALPEILADTGNTNRQLSEFDQQQVIFDNIAGGIREMVGISGEHLNLLKEAIKQDDEFYDEQKAKEERAAAIKESKGDDENKKEGNKLTKSLKDGISGIFAGFKGIFLGTAGIFAAIFAFVAALGNETFREVVFKATDAVGKAFTDFGELIEGDKGLLEFLKENALTLAGITALLMPKKTFGLLFKAVKSLPVALSGLSVAFGTIGTAISTLLSPAILVAGAVAAVLFGIKEGFDAFKEKLDDTGSIMDALAYGISTFNGFLIALPATIFKTLIDGFLGLLEFITFGWLNFDEIQQKIRDMDFAGMVRDAVYNVMGPLFTWVGDTFTNLKNDFIALLERDFLGELLGPLFTWVGDTFTNLKNDFIALLERDFLGELLDKLFSSIKNIGKKIYDPETGAIFGKVLPPFPTLGDIGQFLKDKAKLIYDSDTGAIFGKVLPPFPTLGDIGQFLKDFGKMIYDPDTGAIFGKVLPPFPTLGDIGQFLKDKAKLIYDPETGEIFGYQLPELPSISGMFKVLEDFGKLIYDPETGAIFGYQLPELPSIDDMFKVLEDFGKMIYDPETNAIFGYQLPELPSISGMFKVLEDFGKMIYDPETGAIFGKVLPPFPTLGDIGQFLKDKAKLIYDPETNAIFGYQLPELPSISGMFDKLGDLAKRIYDPDTGAIFGFIPGEVFNFNLPNIGDLFMNLIGSILPDPKSFIGRGLYALPGTDILEQAAKAFSEGGKIVDGVMTTPNTTASLDNTQLDAMEAKQQYEMLMKKMEENEKLTDEQKSFINQYNIMNGGNSVSQSSSTGFSTKKSAYNDDYTMQALAGSMP